MYIIGIPDGFSHIDGFPNISGARVPYYSVLVGREYGRPVFVAGAVYPIGEGYFEHDEAFVKTPVKIGVDSYPYFGYWPDREAFLKDYEGSTIKPGFVSKFKPFKTGE